MFHTKMLIKEMDLQNYLFNSDVYEVPPKTRLAITNALRREMIEIFSGCNVYRGGCRLEGSKRGAAHGSPAAPAYGSPCAL